jgi:hypothetical protein
VKIVQRPLSLFVLLLVLLVGGIAIARTRTVRNDTAAPVTVECADDCKDRLDKTLERCSQMPDARRARCQEIANEQYSKCIERCGERAH